MLGFTPATVTPDAARAALAAVGEVAGQPERPGVVALVEHLARALGVEASEARATDPANLAAALEPSEARLALVQRLVLAAMIVPPLDAARLGRLEAYASALGCAHEPALVDLRLTLAGRHRRLTSRLMGRFPPMVRVREAWKRGSWGQRWRMAKALARLPDAATAARYRALAELPPTSLGRAFYEHCREHGFPLPGERRGLPEPMTFHDMGHALVGAGTDIAGETTMAGFEAGCFRERGFTMLEFTLLLFNLGAKLPTDAAPAVGAVDLGLLLRSYDAGLEAELDLIAWDPWADREAPLDQLRERYAIASNTAP